jgi:hypothetical protein
LDISINGLPWTKTLSLLKKILLVLLVSSSTLEADTLKIKNNFVNPFELYGRDIIFDVYREADKVGSHIVRFEGELDNLTVISEFNLSIDILFINAYKFRYRSKANWQKGLLNKLSVEVNDDGDKFSFDANKRLDKLLISNMKNSFEAFSPVYPTNHWNAGVLNQKQVLNTLTGELNQVEIIKKGNEVIDATQGKIKAVKYVYTGDLQTEVWYDKKNRWVGMQFIGSDGSVIKYVCQKCLGTSTKK